MSRHQIRVTVKGEEFFFIYGYDNPLQQYFLEQWKAGKHEDNPVDLVGPFGYEDSGCLYGSAYNLRKVMDRVQIWDKIPEHHRSRIMGDLPV